MEYVYAALILHQVGKKIDEAGLKRIVEAAGVQPDEAKIKSLIASLDGVDIKKVLEEAKAQPVAAVAAPMHAAHPAEAGKEKKKKEKEEKEEAAEGLSALFG